MRTPVLLFLAVSILASCHYAAADPVYVPDHPGYEEDIRPLFSDHCLLCHGHPANRGAPGTFRLDVYDDTDGIAGALSYARISLVEIQARRMPPAAKDGEGVGPNGTLILQRWIADGLPRKRP